MVYTKDELYWIYENRISPQMSDKQIVSEMFNYFSQDDLNDFLNHLNRCWDMCIPEFNEYYDCCGDEDEDEDY